MNFPAKKIAIALVALTVGYFALFKTNLIIHRTRDFSSFARDLEIRRNGGEPLQDSVIATVVYEDELKKDFLNYFVSARFNLILGGGGEAVLLYPPQELAWQVDRSLFLVNIGSIIGLEKDFEPNRWRKNVSLYAEERWDEIPDSDFYFVAFVSYFYDEMVFVDSDKANHLDDGVLVKIKEIRREIFDFPIESRK